MQRRREDRNKQIAEQASQWLERLERTLKAGEAASLREWLRSPVHREVIIQRCKLWHGPDVLAVLDKLIPHDVALSYLPPVRRRSRAIVAWTLAISLVALSAFVLLGGMSGIENEAQVKVVRTEGFYRTPVGGHKQVDLPDGTQITMGSASVLYINYGPMLRVISLRRGEIMFDVALDAAHRPFQLTVGPRVIEAEQARFAVHRSAPDRAEIQVLAGSVTMQRPRVSAPSTPAELRDPLQYSHGAATLLAGDAGTFGPSWQSISRRTASN